MTEAAAPSGGLWRGDEVHLEPYLDRIGYTGDRAPTAESLRALQRAHVLSMPFENLDPVLGRGVSLELPALQDKMVRGGRGGYCFEHVSLFAAALERLGFGVTGLIGRVRLGSDKIKPATHAVLRVETAESPRTGRAWLCDVGFGMSPLVPLELADGAEASAGDWRYRLEHAEVTPGAEGWVLHVWSAQDGRWFDRHTFTPGPAYPVDYQVASHFVSTHPRSPFVTRPFLQRVYDDRGVVLDGRTLSTFRPRDGSTEKRELEPPEAVKTLATVFRVHVTASDEQRLTALLAEAGDDR
ncbi:arylamine N-acetyltransferase family protein [Streptomyces winkii]|uniref:arylamine N-acetyltransferase family protein n=1 Tax=Streptomyces winkii TaxID=3051178 RepID=UPI0028D4B8A8|nr:arylamine N-acetyltransferase [Streptomyces sp. DSM 40971]